jgi:hypothetical protein
VGVLFSLETISFDEQKLFSFMRSHLSMLSLSCCAAGFFALNLKVVRSSSPETYSVFAFVALKERFPNTNLPQTENSSLQ